LLEHSVVAFFIAHFMASLTRGPIFSGQLNLYGAYVYDLEPQAIGLLATTVTAISIPISLASGWIMDRFGRKATLVPGFSLLVVALGFISATAYFQVPFELFVVAYIAVYACNGLTGGNMQTLGSDLAPADSRGRFYGVSQTIGQLGGPFSTSGFAVLSGMVGYWSAFAALAVTSAGAAVILATRVRDRLRDARVAAASR
jgi:MFS family permease